MSTNNDARRLEQIILTHYCGEHERADPVRISWTNEIKNVLVDVMHLASERGVDIDQALAAAGYVYLTACCPAARNKLIDQALTAAGYVYRAESRGENTNTATS